MSVFTIGPAVCAGLVVALLDVTPAAAQLRGHGGPIRALAVAADGNTALSGSFDASAIRWSLRDDAAQQVMRFHNGAVDAVAILPDGRDVTAGEDGRIALWTPGRQQPDEVLEGHTAPVVALAVSPGGQRLASASWDGTVRLWRLDRSAPVVLTGHRQNVNGVAFSPDKRTLASVGYDGTLRLWPIAAPDAPTVVNLPTPLNAVVVEPSGDIVTAGADGKAYLLSSRGELRASAQISPAPITALAMSPDGTRIAAANTRGGVSILDGKSLSTAHELTGGGTPIWALAFLPDGKTLLTGGADRVIRRWDIEAGQQIAAAETHLEDPLATYAGDPGAELFRACIACHTLKPDEGNRAGPSLHGIFGRHIATLPGYNFSPALKQLDIVWTPATLAKLLELGPARYTPGTKMPEQRIGSAADRNALIGFLQRATR